MCQGGIWTWLGSLTLRACYGSSFEYISAEVRTLIPFQICVRVSEADMTIQLAFPSTLFIRVDPKGITGHITSMFHPMSPLSLLGRKVKSRETWQYCTI
ncbi:hypothetical protein QQP08_009689 [Theobroma cacao]|nr:hypothetical protein QQP08_009689 [Theobroma cacao]